MLEMVGCFFSTFTPVIMRQQNGRWLKATLTCSHISHHEDVWKPWQDPGVWSVSDARDNPAAPLGLLVDRSGRLCIVQSDKQLLNCGEWLSAGSLSGDAKAPF